MSSKGKKKGSLTAKSEGKKKEQLTAKGKKEESLSATPDKKMEEPLTATSGVKKKEPLTATSSAKKKEPLAAASGVKKKKSLTFSDEIKVEPLKTSSKQDDNEEATSKEEEIISSSCKSGRGDISQKPPASSARESPAVPDPRIIKMLQAKVAEALCIATESIMKLRISSEERTEPTAEERTKPANDSIPEECDARGTPAAQRRLAMRDASHLSISPADKDLYKAFQGGFFKGKSFLDMCGIEGAEREALEEWDRDSKRLLQAAKVGDFDRSKELLCAGADPNAYDEKENTTVLVYAAAGGHEKIVSGLLMLHANVDAQNLSGRTALMEAAANGHLKIVKRLVKAKANIMLTDISKQSAFSLAYQRGHHKVAKFLYMKEKAETTTGEAGISAASGSEKSPKDDQSQEVPASETDVKTPEVPVMTEYVKERAEATTGEAGIRAASGSEKSPKDDQSQEVPASETDVKTPEVPVMTEDAEAASPEEATASPPILKPSDVPSETSDSSRDEQVVPDA